MLPQPEVRAGYSKGDFFATEIRPLYVYLGGTGTLSGGGGGGGEDAYSTGIGGYGGGLIGGDGSTLKSRS